MKSAFDCVCTCKNHEIFVTDVINLQAIGFPPPPYATDKTRDVGAKFILAKNNASKR